MDSPLKFYFNTNPGMGSFVSYLMHTTGLSLDEIENPTPESIKVIYEAAPKVFSSE